MIGNQIPRIRIEPESASTDGAGATLLMAEYGYKLDEWQELVLDAWLKTDEAGNYIVTSAGLSVPRQNGKNCIIEAREFYGLLINGEKILHTAHQVRTCKRAFRRLVAFFTDKKHPEICKMVENIRYGIGEECITLKNGGQIEFTSRSRQTARGFDGLSLVVFDESQELTDEQSEALVATLSASATGTRQMLYIGTPNYPGCAGEVFRRFRETCINMAPEDNKHNVWHEWSICADTLEGIDITERKLWYETNPALNVRLSEEFTKAECDALSPGGFARERLGWWSPTVTAEIDYAIDQKLWDDCKSAEPKPEGKTAYGVKFSADGASVALAGCVIDNAGKARISLIEYKPLGYGTKWLAEWLNERYKIASCVVIDGKNGSDILVERIADVWVFKGSVIKPTAQNVITSANLLITELNERSLTWYDKQEALRESALSSTKRNIAGGWGFGGAYSAPIEACSLALWGARTSKRNPQKKMRIG